MNKMTKEIKNEIERMMGSEGYIKEPVVVCDKIYFLPDGGVELVAGDEAYIPRNFYISRREGFYKIFSHRIYLVPDHR